jgi:hypothetical protein
MMKTLWLSDGGRPDLLEQPIAAGDHQRVAGAVDLDGERLALGPGRGREGAQQRLTQATRGDGAELHDVRLDASDLTLLLERAGQGQDLGVLLVVGPHDERAAGVVADDQHAAGADGLRGTIVLVEVELADHRGDLRGLAALEGDDACRGHVGEARDVQLPDDLLDAFKLGRAGEDDERVGLRLGGHGRQPLGVDQRRGLVLEPLAALALRTLRLGAGLGEPSLLLERGAEPLVERAGDARGVGVGERDDGELASRVVLLGVELGQQGANALPLRGVGADDQ